MATRTHTIVDKELHHNINGSVRSVGDIFRSSAIPISITIHSFIGRGAIGAGVTSQALRSSVTNMVFTCRGHSRSPLKLTHRLYFLKISNGFDDGIRTLICSNTIFARQPKNVTIEVLEHII